MLKSGRPTSILLLSLGVAMLSLVGCGDDGGCSCDIGFVCDENLACVDPPDGCAFREAEHPSYTTENRDVVLCGNTYDSTNIETACGTGWQVCLLSEWEDRYPAGVYPGGLLSTWGADQAVRCLGSVWEANRPEADDVWTGDVCYDPNDLSNASYNPWNDGKFLLADDGMSILQGDGSWGEWDTSFSATADTDDFAVYCCRE